MVNFPQLAPSSLLHVIFRWPITALPLGVVLTWILVSSPFAIVEPEYAPASGTVPDLPQDWANNGMIHHPAIIGSPASYSIVDDMDKKQRISALARPVTKTNGTPVES